MMLDGRIRFHISFLIWHLTSVVCARDNIFTAAKCLLLYTMLQFIFNLSVSLHWVVGLIFFFLFNRILCAQRRWRVLPVLLRNSQRGDPGSQHAFPVPGQQSISRWALDCGGWMQLWYPGGHHQSWLSGGTIYLEAVLNLQYISFLRSH